MTTSEYLSSILLEETNDETDSFRNSLFRLNPLFDNFSFYTQEEIPSSNSFELNEGNQSFNRDDSKANSFLNEKVKRGRKKDSAIGNKRPAHGKLARDNIKRKIQVHYLNFLRNFVNQILYDILDQYKDMKYNQFYPLNHSFTKDITKKSFDKLKKTTIGEIFKNNTSIKFKVQKNLNLLVYNEVINKNKKISNILNKKYLEFFNHYYYNIKEINLLKYDIDKTIIIDPNIEFYKDLIKKECNRNDSEINNDEIYHKKIEKCIKEDFFNLKNKFNSKPLFAVHKSSKDLLEF